jgi:putative transposase
MVLKPAREHATNNAQTYFVTSDTWERRALFRSESWARLFFKTLLSHRGDAYLLHEFVLMPDHFHLLMTPETALEKAVQLIKGGFSFRAKKELGSNMEVWQRGFSDHRVRDLEDYDKHRHYIHMNPVKKHLCASPMEYRYSSAYPGWKLDPIPQGLKPGDFYWVVSGTTEVVPFQSMNPACGTAETEPFQSIESEKPPVFVETKGRVLKGDEVLKGHDFSRALDGSRRFGSLAPEEGQQ